MSLVAIAEFDAATQSLDALQAAAYRLIGTGTCEIDRLGSRFACRLTLDKHPKQRCEDAQALRTLFLALVSDENLRARVAARTDGVRNVILSLAFGSLAQQPEDRC